MSVPMPKIDKRTYEDLIAQLRQSAAEFTAIPVNNTRAALDNKVLHKALEDPATHQPYIFTYNAIDNSSAVPKEVPTQAALVDGTPLGDGSPLGNAALEYILQLQDVNQVMVKRWQPAQSPQADVGTALIHIFARMATIAIDRLNRVPDKNFLAFLDLIGAQLAPPQPARVPLTFQKSPGNSIARVLAGTQVAAPPDEVFTTESIYETDADLTVTGLQLIAAFARQPVTDTYADYSNVAGGQQPDKLVKFSGDQIIEHSIYIALDNYVQDFEKPPTDQSLRINFQLDKIYLTRNYAFAIEYWDGKHWTKLNSSLVFNPSIDYTIQIPVLPVIVPCMINNQMQHWLRIRLLQPKVIRGGADVKSILLGNNATDIVIRDNSSFDAFRNQTTQYSYMWFRIEAATNTPLPLLDPVVLPASVTLTIPQKSNLVLLWEFWNGATWQELGRTGDTSGVKDFSFVDETRSFTASGLIKFSVPSNWHRRALFNQPDGYWVRVSIAEGIYDNIPNIKFLMPYPNLSQLSLTWIGANGQGELPEKALFNQTQIDLSKDFYPFGETPNFNDTFYLSNEQAFGGGSRVTLTVSMTPSKPASASPLAGDTQEALQLVWEYWNTQTNSWQIISTVNDATKSFTANGTIQFTLPATAGAVDVIGEKKHWVRVRIKAGSYGKKEKYTTTTVQYPGGNPPNVTVNVYNPAVNYPPCIESLTISHIASSSKPIPLNYLLCNDFSYILVSSGTIIPPFVPTQEWAPTLYLGFNQPFPNRTIPLYFEVRRDVIPQENISDNFVWEYRSQSGWKKLNVQDETNNFTQPGFVSFIGSLDCGSSSEFGITAYWLRIRWENGNYSPSMPLISRILTNTTWATQATSSRNEVLGSSNGEKDQRFVSAHTPILIGQRLEVLEVDRPSTVELEELQAAEGENILMELDDHGGYWVRWHQVTDFYASGADDRVYTLDAQTGVVLFGDGQRGRIPTSGRNNIRLSYSYGGGSHGNRPAGAITELKTAVPYVASVSNYQSAEGGADADTLDDLRQRGPTIIRHRQRAVVAEDFEDLTYLASPEVARVKALTTTKENAGLVRILLVPNSPDTLPSPSLELISRVSNYLIQHADPTLSLSISPPIWVSVSVQADIVPVSLEKANSLVFTVDQALRSFLNPLTGAVDGKGWPFGRQPHESDIFRLIESIPDVDHVHRLILQSAADTAAPSQDMTLIYSGQHQINLMEMDD
ncbi:MAG: putative baseplate assembly protein [Anaerolineaceae bacterium]|nr:putative baseplate assembly protein [Anaerolineaceae bacterium]